MSSNFYTNSYLKNSEEARNEKNKEKETMAAMLKELQQVVSRLDNIEKAMSK
tara:strand:- start:181 stop:336 length:156 start_codon:yes stop_codon:yes gene_type:complete